MAYSCPIYVVLCIVIKKRWGKREVMICDKNQSSDLSPHHSKDMLRSPDTQILNQFCPLKPDLRWHLPLLYSNRHICPHHPAPIFFVCFYCLYSGTAVSIPVLTASFSFVLPSPTLRTSLYSLCPCLLFIPQSQQHQLTYSSCYTSRPSSTIVCSHRR